MRHINGAKQQGTISYSMLFIVVFLAVVSGNLTTHYIELKLVARAADRALQKANERTQQASERQKERKSHSPTAVPGAKSTE